ncbi:unnamed protein product [Agarophyton chilense]
MEAPTLPVDGDNAMRRLLVSLALVACLPVLVYTRLTRDVFLDGQTVAPKSVDYIHFPHPFSKRSQLTCSLEAPFFTLDHQACENARPQAVLTDDGYIGIINTISAANLSRVSTSRRHLAIVLFHGGPTCKHSRAVLPTWVKLTRRMRASCLLAVDAAVDSMMNYNLMVVGFPTIMRASPETSATYRGDRSLQDLIAWAVKVGANAPMPAENIDHLNSDLERYELSLADIRDEHFDVLDIREEAAKQIGINWTLIAANIVTFLYFAWKLRTAHRAFSFIRKLCATRREQTQQ